MRQERYLSSQRLRKNIDRGSPEAIVQALGKVRRAVPEELTNAHLPRHPDRTHVVRRAHAQIPLIAVTRRAIFGLLTAILSITPALSDISGIAHVIDADTIEVLGQRIRLHGIDAPEAKQTCRRNGAEWRCGRGATRALYDKIGNKPVRCEGQDRDRYGRVVAKCFFAGTDINEWLVQQGWAVAYVQYSQDYVGAEAFAKSERRGIWAGAFVGPQEWRRGIRLSSAKQPPAEGCLIKGNITKSGKIYHVPGSRWYDATVIDVGRGERMFCSAEEAVAAGWRAPN